MSNSHWCIEVTKSLEKLSAEVRPMLEAQIKIETKTITVDGKEYTVRVKICPTVHATGTMGRPFHRGSFNFDKLGNQIK